MDEPELLVADADWWRLWLGEHHARAGPTLVVLAKKGTLAPTSLTFAKAFCHGWIDGRVRRRDETTYRQGLAAVERARADGTWTSS